jgi:hypothetical protein
MDLLLLIYDASWSLPSFILIFVYSWLLVQIWKGNRNKWLLCITCMLFVSLFGSITKGYALYMFTFSGHATYANVWELAIAEVLNMGVFGLAHYMLAVKYRSMATNMPLILEG